MKYRASAYLCNQAIWYQSRSTCRSCIRVFFFFPCCREIRCPTCIGMSVKSTYRSTRNFRLASRSPDNPALQIHKFISSLPSRGIDILLYVQLLFKVTWSMRAISVSGILPLLYNFYKVSRIIRNNRIAMQNEKLIYFFHNNYFIILRYFFDTGSKKINLI